MTEEKSIGSFLANQARVLKSHARRKQWGGGTGGGER
jgi:hypothetical protein